VLRTPDQQLQVNVPSEFSFDAGSAAIKPEMRPVLDAFADDLKAEAFSHMRVRIVGFADSRGDEAANDILSLARAVSVRKHLEGRGIAGSRIEVEGRGESQPQVSNDKAYGRALNRRVEIYLREPVGKPDTANIK
jgi:outer membrane protein OmpA-like peptidoglycan-associated protein